ncbi:hypothetical protein BZG01_00090 [Labilibaculum manganireducens]|uniref:HNH nuclease domain-containing protein n=1 Tax=Labilibaculum manganireducens TaxID=1940525 RepID=A0A2N3IGA5_9BACT|nr:HNH endonuclease [Labilibaculum manganireducens]PKQ69372.1 hypothetical protein BZG01_00090 [Labilibaculum manganireducens]
MKKFVWYPDEILFLQQNFYSMTNAELLTAINGKRPASEQIKLSAMRHECLRMGLSRGIQIRWSQADISFLKNNYKSKGNEELAQLLTARKKTFRIINGKRIYRTFTRKHVEKKMLLMGFKRNADEYLFIRKRNIETGISKALSSDDNLWTNGTLSASNEGDTRVWRINGKLVRRIKINGTFIPYSRWLYEQRFGKVPVGLIVFHLDFDSLNDSLDNLEIRKKRRISYSDRSKAVGVLKIRVSKQVQQLGKLKSKSEIHDAHKELRRLRGLLKGLEVKIGEAKRSRIVNLNGVY